MMYLKGTDDVASFQCFQILSGSPIQSDLSMFPIQHILRWMKGFHEECGSMFEMNTVERLGGCQADVFNFHACNSRH